jgi:maltooligosyltrehalose trehalohydrolase
MGDRLATFVAPERLRLAMALLALSPSVPLLFMGEEFAARSPFLFFCDFHGDLATAVRDGRRREFASFARFADPKAREAIPDPNARETFLASKLPWADLDKPEHASALAHCRTLLGLRARTIVPLLAEGAHGSSSVTADGTLAVDWSLGKNARMHVRANAGDEARAFAPAAGRTIHVEGPAPTGGRLAPWSAVWTLED